MERKIPFRENWLIFYGIWEDAELIIRIVGAKENTFREVEEFSLRDLGRSMHFFQGSREHIPPCGPHFSCSFSCLPFNSVFKHQISCYGS